MSKQICASRFEQVDSKNQDSQILINFYTFRPASIVIRFVQFEQMISQFFLIVTLNLNKFLLKLKKIAENNFAENSCRSSACKHFGLGCSIFCVSVTRNDSFLLIIGPVSFFINLCNSSSGNLLGSLAQKTHLELLRAQRFVIGSARFAVNGSHSLSRFWFRLVEIVWLDIFYIEKITVIIL